MQEMPHFLEREKRSLLHINTSVAGNFASDLLYGRGKNINDMHKHFNLVFIFSHIDY